MSCDYSGDIEPTNILWYHDGLSNTLTAITDILIVKGSYNNNLQRSTLTIKSPKPSSSNRPYTCAVSMIGASTLNHVVSSSVRTARVSDGNSLSVSQVTVSTSELVVTCVVEGEVTPAFINWFKVNGDTLQHMAVKGESKTNIYSESLVSEQNAA